MVAAGYTVEASDLKTIHCNTQLGCERLSWLENGFIQCFCEVDGQRARVMDYAPGQLLQPHAHDIDELFEIRGGSVLVSRWPSGAVGAPGETAVLKRGDRIVVPANMPHALCCDIRSGLQFHELVAADSFAKRETRFLCGPGDAYAMARA